MATEHKWHGDAIGAELTRATAEGMEAVAADFVRVAHPLTPYLQGFLDRSTKWGEVEQDALGGLSLEMGSFDIEYAEAQERGTSQITGKLFYQRATDETWPKLNDRIKAAMRHPAV